MQFSRMRQNKHETMSETKCCQPFDHPSFAPSWVCGKCKPPCLNGNQRTVCKVCAHQRCDDPSVRIVPIKEEGGILFVPVKRPETKGSN